MNAVNIIEQIRHNRDPEQAAIRKKYHKSDLIFNGLSVPLLRQIAADALREIRSSDELFRVFYELWQLREFETCNIAVFMMMKRIKWLDRDHFIIFYPLLRQCDGWVLTDYIGIKILGEFLRKFPEYHDHVDLWRKDDHLWVRRAGILRFIAMAKHKDPWPERMERVLLFHTPETNFFIRKVIGWNLREWARTDAPKVISFIKQHRNKMNALTFREATKHLEIS